MDSSLWNNVLSVLEKDLNRQTFDLWFRDSLFHSSDHNSITIAVMDNIAVQHMKENYTQKIEAIIRDITRSHYSCNFITVEESASSPDTRNEQQTQTTTPFENIYSANINPSYTFDTFVVGPNNQFAHAAAKSVVQAPAKNFNPLFFWGHSGLGKTHLIMAIGNELKNTKEFLNVHYIHTSQFIDEYVHSIRNNTTESFKIKLLDGDVLLMDDIQLIQGKSGSQEFFFQIFNHLHQKAKQIVITSDRPPKELKELEDRLRTRFEGGMLIDLQPPNLETREAILKNKAERENLELSDDLVYYIARRIKSNIRTLEGAIMTLKVINDMTGHPLTIQQAKQYLRDKFEDEDSFKVNIKDIMEKIAEKFSITVNELKSRGRQTRIVQPRFVAMYVARQLTDLTTPEIGSEFGGRDHSTVLNAIKSIEEQIEEDVELQEIIDDIINELKN